MSRSMHLSRGWHMRVANMDDDRGWTSLRCDLGIEGFRGGGGGPGNIRADTTGEQGSRDPRDAGRSRGVSATGCSLPSAFQLPALLFLLFFFTAPKEYTQSRRYIEKGGKEGSTPC